MSPGLQMRLGFTLIGTILFVYAGVSFLTIVTNDEAASSLYHGLTWLSFGLATVSMSLLVTAFDEPTGEWAGARKP